MPLAQTNKERKHNEIRAEYKKLKDIKEYGVQKYTSAVIIMRLADKYFLAKSTVESIVWSSN